MKKNEKPEMRIGKNEMVVIDQGLEVKYRLGLGVDIY